MWNSPKSVQKCPKSVQKCPKSVQNCPKSVQKCPKSVQKVSKSVQKVSKKVSKKYVDCGLWTPLPAFPAPSTLPSYPHVSPSLKTHGFFFTDIAKISLIKNAHWSMTVEGADDNIIATTAMSLCASWTPWSCGSPRGSSSPRPSMHRPPPRRPLGTGTSSEPYPWR